MSLAATVTDEGFQRIQRELPYLLVILEPLLNSNCLGREFNDSYGMVYDFDASSDALTLICMHSLRINVSTRGEV